MPHLTYPLVSTEELTGITDGAASYSMAVPLQTRHRVSSHITRQHNTLQISHLNLLTITIRENTVILNMRGTNNWFAIHVISYLYKHDTFT